MRARKLWPWVVGLAVLGIAGASRYNAVRNDAELAEQLRLAWAEGIPTNAEQMATFYPPVDPAKNAAPYYSALVGKGNPRGYKELSDVLAFPNPKTIAAAEAVLKANSLWLSVGDRAVTFPECRFDRDWSQAKLYSPEPSVFRSLMRLYSLRAVAYAARHDSDAAIADVRRMLLLSRHARDAGFFTDWSTSRAMYAEASDLLAYFAYELTPQRPYLDELRRVVSKVPPANLKREIRENVFSSLVALELSYSPGGRESLGLKPDDISATDRLYLVLVSLSAAKISLLKRRLAVWKVADKSASERAKFHVQEEASFASWLFGTTAESWNTRLQLPERVQDSKLKYIALIRALEQGKPKTMSFPDLVSPVDKKPLTYENNGTCIEISSWTMPPCVVRFARIEAQRAGTGMPPTAPTAKK